MHQVFLILFLSIPSILCEAEGKPGTTLSTLAGAPDHSQTTNVTVLAVTQTPTHVETQSTATQSSPQVVTVPAHGNVSTVLAESTANKTETPKIDDNKTAEKKPEDHSVVPPKPAQTNVSTSTMKTDSSTNVVPAAKTEKANETTTAKSITTTPKPTEAPKAHDIPIQQARGFDGPSFIGGIILTLGLLAIGFMGFKYYKNQTERNYHTL